MDARPSLPHPGPARQIHLVRVEIRQRGDEGTALFQAQRHLQLLRDRPGNLLLHGEHVVQRPVVGLRPEVKSVVRVHELGRDPQTVTLFADAPLNEVLNVELSPDLPQVLVLALVGKR